MESKTIINKSFGLVLNYARNEGDFFEQFRPTFEDFQKSLRSISNWDNVRIERDRWERIQEGDRNAILVYVDDVLVGHVPYFNSPIVSLILDIKDRGGLGYDARAVYTENPIGVRLHLHVWANDAELCDLLGRAELYDLSEYALPVIEEVVG